MSAKRPPKLTLRRGEDGELEVDRPEGDAAPKPDFRPGVTAQPVKPDPAQDIPRDQPNPYWGAG